MHFTYTNGAWDGSRSMSNKDKWNATEIGAGSDTTDMKVYSDYRPDWPTRPDAPDPSYMKQSHQMYVKVCNHLDVPADRYNFNWNPVGSPGNTQNWVDPGYYCQHIRWEGVSGGKFGKPGEHTFFWQKKPMRGRRSRLQPLAEGARKL